MAVEYRPFFWRNRHGKPNVRIKGKVFPMHDANGVWHEPGTEEGDRLYWELRRGRAASLSTRSWAKLIESYLCCDRWSNLKPRTRRDYEKVLAYLLAANGSRDMTRLARKDVIAAMEANKHRVALPT